VSPLGQKKEKQALIEMSEGMHGYRRSVVGRALALAMSLSIGIHAPLPVGDHI
jgi:hypothetical protein